MERKNIYTAICIAMGIVFLNSIFWMMRLLLSQEKLYYGSGYWINILFTLFGIAGLVIFAASKFRNSTLLKIYMCKVIVCLPEEIFYYYSFFSRAEITNNPQPMFYVSILLNAVIIVASVIGLWMLTRQRVPKLTHYMIGSESAVSEFAPASAWSRAANYAVDLALIFYTVYMFTEYMRFAGAMSRRYNDYSDGFPPEFLPVICLLLYYFIMEGIFNTSAGKCATNTIIVNSSGQVPSVGHRLGRTLCRLIPFEAFSFFSKSRRGWHDTITDTYVTASTDKYAEQETEDELAGFLSNEEIH